MAKKTEKKDTQPTKFNVLMFGSRRAGKSSILASMIQSFENLESSTENKIKLTALPDTAVLLERKRNQLQDIFNRKNRDALCWTIDEGATDVSYDYEFRMTVEGSKNSYEICFKDIPGEWITTKESWIKDELAQSQIILIAIDTPHLVEEDGEHSDAFNIIENIDRLLQHIQSDKDVPRLILFVPIKCEKYYHENRMDEVDEAIKTQYEALLTAFATGKKAQLYTVAITPILSLGGVVFRDFARKEDGTVDVIEQFDSSNPSLYLRPKAAYYKLYAPAPEFKPQFCEQPVLYLLNFIMKQVTIIVKKAEKKSLLRRGGDVAIALVTVFFGGIPALLLLWKKIFSDKVFRQSALKTVEHIKTTGDGYMLLQDPLGLQQAL